MVEPKICELCRRPFFREVAPIRALAEKECPECCEAEQRYVRRQAQLASRTRVPFWTPQRLAARVLSF